jgi:hypothetical protein
VVRSVVVRGAWDGVAGNPLHHDSKNILSEDVVAKRKTQPNQKSQSKKSTLAKKKGTVMHQANDPKFQNGAAVAEPALGEQQAAVKKTKRQRKPLRKVGHDMHGEPIMKGDIVHEPYNEMVGIVTNVDGDSVTYDVIYHGESVMEPEPTAVLAEHCEVVRKAQARLVDPASTSSALSKSVSKHKIGPVEAVTRMMEAVYDLEWQFGYLEGETIDEDENLYQPEFDEITKSCEVAYINLDLQNLVVHLNNLLSTAVSYEYHQRRKYGGVLPSIPVQEMTAAEIQELLASHDPDPQDVLEAIPALTRAFRFSYDEVLRLLPKNVENVCKQAGLDRQYNFAVMSLRNAEHHRDELIHQLAIHSSQSTTQPQKTAEPQQ